MPTLQFRDSTLFFAATAMVAGWSVAAGAADMPKATMAMLKEAKLDASALSGLDKELAVPQAWIDGSKKEGTLKFRFNLSPANYKKIAAPFLERYPWVKVEYTRGVGAGRAVKPLAAFKTGRYVADIVGAFGSSMQDYLAANALEKIDDMPAWGAVPDDRKNKDGLWAGYQVANWCMSYNPSRIKKADLPKTWKELVSDSSPLKGGRVGIGNRAHLWLINLWGNKEYGPDYMSKEFIPKLMSTLKPQLRKEGINGLMKLASIGEFDVAIPSAGYRVLIQVKNGVPIDFHCPEPVPQYFTEVGIFKNSPRVNTARLLVNWILSKEGQIAQYAYTYSAPIHKGLQDEKYFPYGKEVLGKKVALRTIPMLMNDLPKVYKAWRPAWAGAGGPKAK
jgi:ABC-type Fe3+ transport system substrate-binding protein